MDEISIILKARGFVRSNEILSYPICVESYVHKIKANLHYETNFQKGESGYSVPINGKWHIVINENEILERKRFTICHEIAHIHLGLPTEHEGKSDIQRYIKRPQNEILCDVFAAELLLPSDLFKPLVAESEMGFDSILNLAVDFQASITATGSRFATVNPWACAFVLVEGGLIRYAARSLSLKEMKAWVPIGSRVPPSSLAARGRELSNEGPQIVDPTEWFEDWNRGGVLLEETRYFTEWNRTLSLLWFEDEEGFAVQSEGFEEDNDPICRELDGNLPWPGKKRRR